MMEEIVGIIIIIMAIRAFLAKSRAEKMLYINAMDFAIAALIALYINTPFALVLAAAFFIGSTISANAIAYTLDRLDDEIILDAD